MKWGVRNKTAEKRLKMGIFKLLVLSYMHTTLYLFCFHMSYFIFWNQKRAARKKIEYFFIGSEHP